MFKDFIFPGYVRFSRADRRASRKATDRGRLIQLGMLMSMIIGLDMNRTLVYQLFALLLCILVGSRLMLRLQRPRVSVERHLPSYATANEAFEYYLTVSNVGPNVERDLKLSDNPRVIPPTLEQYRRAREPGEETRNVWDRWIGFHRFMWLQRRNTGILTKTTDVPDISLKGKVRVKVEGLPLRRGVVQFASTTILHPDPLALNHGVTTFDNPEHLLVLPKRYQVSPQLDPAGGRHFQPGGVNPSWSIGESDEFASLRDYRDGDSMRKIHWASSAKRDKPVVKEFQDEYFVRRALVLDTDVDDPDILEEAVSVAASFVFDSDTSDSLLDLMYAHDKVELVTAGRGYAQTTLQLEALATVGRSNTDFDLLARAVLQHAQLISGCILVLADWGEDRERLLDRLRASQVPVTALVVTRDAGLEQRLAGKAKILPLDEIQERLTAP